MEVSFNLFTTLQFLLINTILIQEIYSLLIHGILVSENLYRMKFYISRNERFLLALREQ